MYLGNIIRSILFEGMLGISKGPKLPKVGDNIKIKRGNKIEEMRVSGVEYDTNRESFIINGIISETPCWIFPEQVIKVDDGGNVNIEDIEYLPPEKWMKVVKSLDIGKLSNEDMDNLRSQSLEVELYFRKKANNAENVRLASRYFNEVVWIEDNISNL